MDTNKDLQEQRHPSALSADELEALKASDPTAFDEDEDEGEAAADSVDHIAGEPALGGPVLWSGRRSVVVHGHRLSSSETAGTGGRVAR